MAQAKFHEGDEVWYTGEVTGGQTVAAKIVEIGYNQTVATEPDEHAQYAVDHQPVYVLVQTENPAAPGINVTDETELSAKDDD